MLVLVIVLLLLASPRIRCLRTRCLLGAFHEYELHGTLRKFLGMPKFAENFDGITYESTLWIVKMEGIWAKLVLVGEVFDGGTLVNHDELAEDQGVAVEVIRDDASIPESRYAIIEFGFRGEGAKAKAHDVDLDTSAATNIRQINDVVPQEHARGVMHRSREVQRVTIKGNWVPANGRRVKRCVVFGGCGRLIGWVGGRGSGEQGRINGLHG